MTPLERKRRKASRISWEKSTNRITRTPYGFYAVRFVEDNHWLMDKRQVRTYLRRANR